ncbi:MAG: hypothetical protein ACTSUZ_02700 [Candidatus Thorarchaeota archaeon]
MTIPESELKGVIQSLSESNGIDDEPKVKPEVSPVVDFRTELIAELKSELEIAPQIIEDDAPEVVAEVTKIPEPEAEIKSRDKTETNLVTVLDISYEANSKIKSKDKSKPEE